MIAGIETLGGGLESLTRFTGQIGFGVDGLRTIIEKHWDRAVDMFCIRRDQAGTHEGGASHNSKGEEPRCSPPLFVST